MKYLLLILLSFLSGCCYFNCCDKPPQPTEDANYTNIEIYSEGMLVRKMKICGCPEIESNFISAEVNYDVKICKWVYSCNFSKKTK